jgi:hypothetical protein
MIRLHIIAEGQTEEEFVKSILTEHLGNHNISTFIVLQQTPNSKNAVELSVMRKSKTTFGFG